MTIQELVDKFSKRLLDTSNPGDQEAALTEVIVLLLEELNNMVPGKIFKKKKDIKSAIEKTDAKYVDFVREINKLANKDILREDGFKIITRDKFKAFL